MLLFSSGMLLSQDEPRDFRRAHWGMSPEEVKVAETSKPLQEPQKGRRTMLVYSDTIASLDCHVFYVFAEQKLVRGKYVVSVSHTNKTDYLDDYRKLLSSVADKYGEPKEEKSAWKNNLYKNDPQEWGMAVAVGHLVKMARWETPRSEIYLMLKGDNFDITLALEYASKELQALEEGAKKQDDSEKF